MKMIELIKYAKVPIELNRDGVTEVAILTDTGREPEIAEAFAAVAYEMGLEPTIVTMIARPVHGLEPTAVMAQAVLGSQLMLFATSTGMAHTECVRNAFKAGKKYLGMPGITIDTLTRGAATADYKEVGRITAVVAEILSEGYEVHITSEFGTDLTFSIEGRKAAELAGVSKPGGIAAFPDGEAPMAAVEGTANGTLVIDSSIHQLGRVKEPVRMSVEKGFVSKIEGGAEAEIFTNIIKTRGDKNSLNIGEFAVGTNPCARASDNVSEDKKRLGSIHIGLGDNMTLGGNTPSSTHIDGVLGFPSLWVDKKQIIDKGKLLVKY
ncbi:MAG: aminopeptidase [Deltaproteobacteria bacterium]|nr:aminopeptidase [Deltaproteobacteria bacterium]